MHGKASFKGSLTKVGATQGLNLGQGKYSPLSVDMMQRG